ncbi:MAG TPA: hypothetical protein VE734_10810 [Terriglobales bacterium]|jgi:hypothetical protein|nr:hypothetical protein [Terriglobales bacterium]
MGYATTRSLERVAAAMGMLNEAPIQFEIAVDIRQGGVLLALPALLVLGLLRHTRRFYQLPKGFYGIESIFLLLALMALARIESIEQVRYIAPGEWGNLVGLDRIPEVRCLRQKLDLLCGQQGRAAEWNAVLAEDWMTALPEGEMLFYADGHVRIYHGDLTALPRHYVPRQRLCVRATTDYWINAMDGQPFFYVNQAVDPGLIATLRDDLVPWLETHAPVSEAHQKRMAEDPRQPRFTLIFDREGYSPAWFSKLQQQRIAVVTYHKFPGEDWPATEFTARQVGLPGGETSTLMLAERMTQLSNGLEVREVRKQTESGKQVPILSTNQVLDSERLAAIMFARWTQENYFRYMREHYGLDNLIEYGTAPVPETVLTVNPAWRELDAAIRRDAVQLQRCSAQFGSLNLPGTLEPASVARCETAKATLQEKIENLKKKLEELKSQRKQTPRHIAVKDLPEGARFERLRPERKQFIDTIKMIAYRAETSMVGELRDRLARADDARALIRQIYQCEVDLLPDLQAKTLTVRLHHLAQNIHDEAVRHLCAELTATETVFPATDLRLIYQLGSS